MPVIRKNYRNFYPNEYNEVPLYELGLRNQVEEQQQLKNTERIRGINIYKQIWWKKFSFFSGLVQFLPKNLFNQKIK